MNILAIIPARSGSKSIKDKNIQSFLGKPLLVHSIDHALGSSLINRVILSTDSEHYAAFGKIAKADIPFLRPAEISGDHATDLEVFAHALNYLKETENYAAEIVVHLRPTAPVRNIDDIDKMIQMLIENPNADSVRSMTKAAETPFKMWFKGADGVIVPVISNTEIKEAYNMPRQVLPTAYIQTAAIDIVRASTITDKHSMTGDIILGYEMDSFIDIDTYEDFSDALMAGFDEVKNKKFCFDMDGVIAHLSPNNDYNLSTPNKTMIEKVNHLYENGNHITVFTARGSESGLDWHQISYDQLTNWGVKFHRFFTGKPNADYYVDDKNVLISQLLK